MNRQLGKSCIFSAIVVKCTFLLEYFFLRLLFFLQFGVSACSVHFGHFTSCSRWGWCIEFWMRISQYGKVPSCSFLLFTNKGNPHFLLLPKTHSYLMLFYVSWTFLIAYRHDFSMAHFVVFIEFDWKNEEFKKRMLQHVCFQKFEEINAFLLVGYHHFLLL